MSAVCAALAEKGYTNASIAAEINKSLPEGEKKVSAARVANMRYYAEKVVNKNVALPKDALRRLTPAAEARGVTVGELVRDIVKTIARDGLVDAVLDDGGAP